MSRLHQPAYTARAVRIGLLILHICLCVVQFVLLLIGNPGYEDYSFIIGAFIMTASVAYALPNVILSCLDHESAFLQSGLDLAYCVTQLVLHIAYAGWSSTMGFSRWCYNRNDYRDSYCKNFYAGISLVYFQLVISIICMVLIIMLVKRRLAQGWVDSWRTGTHRLLALRGVNPGIEGGKRSWRKGYGRLAEGDAVADAHGHGLGFA